MDRPITPPPQFPCLLTPPPTGKFDKQDSFDNVKFPRTKPKRSVKVNEGELLTEFFEEPQEGSETELELSDLEQDPITSADDTAPTSPVSDVSLSTKTTLTNFTVPLASPSKAPTLTEPFPFLQLPLSVRNKIYTHLLRVPGLLCLRQNHATSHNSDTDQLHPEDRTLLPGISHAFVQLTVSGPKTPFSHFPSTNINILLASHEIYAESRPTLYTHNYFEIVRPSTELSPPCDFSIRLFPPTCQRLVTKLHIRIRSFYDVHTIVSKGHEIKNFYRGLGTLGLVLELDSLKRGFGRQWARREVEKRDAYLERLKIEMGKHVLAEGKVKAVLAWIYLSVVFGGESYNEELGGVRGSVADQDKRNEVRNALREAWESLKMSRR